MEVKFYELNQGEEPSIVVIYAKYNGKILMCRHEGRETWEIPGGHIEKGESPEEAAKRELQEETGAIKFNISPVCKYSFGNGENPVYSIMYKAEIIEMGDLPDLEIEETALFEKMPANLTYPEIYEKLFTKIGE